MPHDHKPGVEAVNVAMDGSVGADGHSAQPMPSGGVSTSSAAQAVSSGKGERCLQVRFDFGLLRAQIDELSALVERAGEPVQRFLQRADLSIQIGPIDGDSMAAGAGELRLTAQFTDGAALLSAARRAADLRND